MTAAGVHSWSSRKCAEGDRQTDADPPRARTYELFRAFYAPRPAVRGRDGIHLSGVSGCAASCCTSFGRRGRRTSVGATDRVIESFRNDNVSRLTSRRSDGPRAASAVPFAETAIEALGLVLWPEVEFEADDAIGRRRGPDSRRTRRVQRIVICTRTRTWPAVVVGEARRCSGTGAGAHVRRAGVLEEVGVRPGVVPDWLALVGDSSDGYPGLPGLGAKSAAAVLLRYESIGRDPAEGELVGRPRRSGRRPAWPPFLADQREAALPLRTLARLPGSTRRSRRRMPPELEWGGRTASDLAGIWRRMGLATPTRIGRIAWLVRGRVRLSGGVPAWGRRAPRARACQLSTRGQPRASSRNSAVNAGGAATTPLLAAAWRGGGGVGVVPSESRPSRVTTAPARSAISPAAARSHAEQARLLDETRSNRPLPT